MKNHKILFELVRKEKTEHWAIDIIESVKIMKELSKFAEKQWYDWYIKWNKKEVLDYKPTHKTYQINTVEDIAELTPDQFEMIITDLRERCNIHRAVKALDWVFWSVSSPKWMVRLDTGLNEKIVQVTIKSTNKL
jgi:hypothetical protein